MNMMHFIIINLIIYMPLHFFEEAIGDFPKWMYDHKWMPYHMTHGHWMANNVFIYYPMLLLAAAFYIFGGRNTICFGVAILMWGIINFGDHFFYTIKDRKISPGLVTGILFLISSVFGFRYFILSEGFSSFQLVLGIAIGAVLFGLPIWMCKALHQVFDKYMK